MTTAVEVLLGHTEKLNQMWRNWTGVNICWRHTSTDLQLWKTPRLLEVFFVLVFIRKQQFHMSILHSSILVKHQAHSMIVQEDSENQVESV